MSYMNGRPMGSGSFHRYHFDRFFYLGKTTLFQNSEEPMTGVLVNMPYRVYKHHESMFCMQKYHGEDKTCDVFIAGSRLHGMPGHTAKAQTASWLYIKCGLKVSFCN